MQRSIVELRKWLIYDTLTTWLWLPVTISTNLNFFCLNFLFTMQSMKTNSPHLTIIPNNVFSSDISFICHEIQMFIFGKIVQDFNKKRRKQIMKMVCKFGCWLIPMLLQVRVLNWAPYTNYAGFHVDKNRWWSVYCCGKKNADW